MAARNRARTPVRIRCIKKTTPPETSCGTPEEAYKVPPSLTVAIRDQQLRLVPSRRPRPWTIWTTRVVRGPAGLLASPAHDADRSRAPRRGCAPCENSRYCRRASAGSWPYLPFAISSCVFLPCRTTAAARRSPLMPTGPPGAIRSRRVWRGLPGSSTQTFGVRLDFHLRQVDLALQFPPLHHSRCSRVGKRRSPTEPLCAVGNPPIE
jgi:hypothetical protein